ncbi:MAG: SGNH/GDSL hydrolase family protein, partial [Alphaproteobacteria bacterium]|nr:SGNH/GDSL hydrolase family protein [Alphaproteobacteria bacterium]
MKKNLLKIFFWGMLLFLGAPSAVANANVLTIGDSRTVGMYFSENSQQKYNNNVNATDGNGNSWFASVGQGLNWFNNNINTIQQKAQNSDVIVINLGVNDIAALGNSKTAADRYIKRMNELAAIWRAQGKQVYFTSVNPVGPQYQNADEFNGKIDDFNKRMQAGLSSDITFIDTNSYMKSKLKGSDYDKYGLHYNNSINKDVHQYINQQISKGAPAAATCLSICRQGICDGDCSGCSWCSGNQNSKLFQFGQNNNSSAGNFALTQDNIFGSFATGNGGQQRQKKPNCDPKSAENCKAAEACKP